MRKGIVKLLIALLTINDLRHAFTSTTNTQIICGFHTEKVYKLFNNGNCYPIRTEGKHFPLNDGNLI